MAVAASTEGMPLARVPRARSLSAVRIWIYSLAALVVLMVAVGGATRLTGSGLSITEWKPVTGAIPPLTEQAWLAEFEKYRQISQYELVNKGMTLSEFKFIYGWEWGHRQLGRLIGLVFFLPLVWFWARGAIKGRLGADAPRHRRARRAAGRHRLDHGRVGARARHDGCRPDQARPAPDGRQHHPGLPRLGRGRAEGPLRMHAIGRCLPAMLRASSSG